jgi:restriction endonuclease Mrr
MRPRRWRQEFEVMGGIILFVLVLLGLVFFALYEHGYLGIAVAVLGSVAAAVGLIRAFRVWTARRQHGKRRRPQEEEEWQKRPRWEQKSWPERKEPPLRSVPEERRQEEERRRDPLKRDAIVKRINEISDGEFGQLMAHYFRQQGYTIDTTMASGDRGADLVITGADRRIAVRLKRQDNPVENRAIQEALAGRAFYGAYEAWLITNDTFTRGAHNDARVAGVRLIDGNELAGWLNKLLDQLEDEPP